MASETELQVETLGEALRRVANLAREDDLIYIDREGGEQRQSFQTLLRDARRIGAGLRGAGLRAGDRVILQIERNDDLLPSFWGCVLGGMVPLIAPIPPSYESPGRLLDQFVHICRLLQPCTVVAGDALAQAAQTAVHSLADLNVGVAALEGLRHHAPERESGSAQPDDPAMFTLTSGSTSLPKCVPLTHRNLVARAAGANELGRHSDRDVALNWLPFDHIGSLSDWHLRCVLAGCRAVYVPKEYILSQPDRWLELIERYRVTHTWAPNFAYGLVNDLLTKRAERPWDLSSVEAFLTAGEAVSDGVTQRFAELLAPCGLRPAAFRPAFGMAEMGSGVTYFLGTPETPLRVYRARRSSLGGKLQPADPDDASAVACVSLGPPIPGVTLRIVDAEGNVLPEETVGHFQVRGEPVSQGYYRAPEASLAFRDDGWFDTGDLGFLCDGELYLTGRAKESIIVNGANYGCSEIESLVDSVPGVEPSFTAACAVRPAGAPREQLAIFFHTTDRDGHRLAELLREIRGCVARRIGIRPDYLLPVAKEAIPKTAIGKLQRAQLVRRFEEGEFQSILATLESLEAGGEAAGDVLEAADVSPAAHGAEGDAARRLNAIWKEVLSLPRVGPRDNLFELGGNSVLLVQLHARIEAEFGPRLTVVDLFQYPTIESQARLLASAAEAGEIAAPARRGRQRAEARRRGASEPSTSGGVAIIGMACRLPGAANVDQFWRNLTGGVESISFFTAEQVLAAGADPQLVRDPGYVRAAPVLDGIEQFDAEFFGYTAREAELMDPQQRLLLQCAWEAIEDAGYPPRDCPGAVGVFASGLLNTYLLNNVYPSGAHREGGEAGVMTLSSTGGFQVMVANDKDYLPTRISYKLNLRGPSVNVQTACSSSLVAIHMAAESLLRGECDMALAGGTSVSVPQDAGYLYREGLLASPDGHCRAFDADARGTVFGNGAGLVLLKRLDDALADGDHIYAVVRGSAMNNDGGEKAGYMAPSQDGQAAVVAEALAAAGVSAETIAYVEAHGTGTALGDPIEIAGLTQAFRADTGRSQFCAVGSVKTNVGHLQIASGIAGFIKSALVLHHKQLVPSLHYSAPNPRIDFAGSPFYVNTELRGWPEAEHPRRASVNSLGIGGTNVHVILEESPARVPQHAVIDRPRHLLTLSARTPEALGQLADRCAAKLGELEAADLADACFTANAGRAHFSERLAVHGGSLPELRDALVRYAERRGLPSELSTAAAEQSLRVAFLFAGEESHPGGAGRELYESSPTFRRWIEECDAIARPMLNDFVPVAAYCGWTESSANRPAFADAVRADGMAQAATFAVEHALARLWLSWGVTPAAVVGQGIGQYVAACIAGVFTLDDALRLVVERSQAIAAVPPGERLSEAAIESFRAVAMSVNYRPPRFAFLPLLDDASPAEIAGADYWCRHLTEPAPFCAGVSAAVERGCSMLLAIGPPSPILQHARQCLSAENAVVLPAAGPSPSWLSSFECGQSDWSTLLASLATLYVRGAAVDWNGFDGDYPRRRLSLTTYPFQPKRYWIDRPRPAVSQAAMPTQGTVGTGSLLGRRISSPALKDVVFESRVGLASLPILDDHRFYDTPILPGAFQLAAIVEAATRGGDSRDWAVEDVAFTEALAAPAGGERVVQWIVSDRGDASRSFQLVSRADGDDEDSPWTVHTTGRIAPADRQAPHVPSEVRQAAERLTAAGGREVSAEEFYATMQAHQVELGPRLQAVERAWIGAGEILCRVGVPPALAGDGSPLPCAVLLDACVQVLGGAEAYPAGFTRIPTAVRQFRFYRRSESKSLWCHLRITADAAAGSARWTADAWLFEPDGQAVAQFVGLELVDVPRDGLVRALAKREDTGWLYRPAWIAYPMSTSSSAAADRRAWLILADSGGVGDRLAAKLRARGAECTVVRRSELGGADADAYRRVIESAWTTAGPERGIVHLGSLDRADEENPLTELSSSCTRFLHLVQALDQSGGTAGLRMALVTRASQAVEGQPRPVDPVSGALWGISRTAALEYPEMQCRRVDLDAAVNAGEAAFLADELLSDANEPDVAIRGGTRHVARLERYLPETGAPPAIRADRTYLVTGGTGGLGLHVAGWLVEQGARHLVLASRGGASSPRALRAVESWRRQGVDVAIPAADVSREDDLAALLARIGGEMPALAGIVHAAGTRDDGTLARQSREQFDAVLAAKAAGAWNLHRLTRHMPLDFFVGFSSIASLLGSAGQANYAAANAYLDGLLAQRRSANLPGLSIHWGPWQGDGMWASLAEADRQALARRGIAPLEPSEALGALPALLGGPAAHAAAVRADWTAYARETGVASTALLEGLLPVREASTEAQAAVRLRLERAPQAERRRLLLEHVRGLVRHLLGGDADEALDLDRGFYEIGFDSLSILMLRSRLQTELGLKLPATIAFQFSTLGSLVEHLAETLGLTKPASAEAETAPAGGAASRESATELEQLSTSELADRLAAKLAALRRPHGAT